jgi:superfamily II DNA or RNA helicase
MPEHKSRITNLQPSLPDVPPPQLGDRKKAPRNKQPQKTLTREGSDIFIVDNSDENWKVVNYLKEWTRISSQFDIATGYFEIGALLALDKEWQKLEKMRILMGDEVSKRTKQAFEKGLEEITHKLDDSIEAAKDENDFLEGVPAIVEAIRSGQIETRVYRKKKFHAKAYITHSNLKVVGSAALVGSSNFTFPGINQNVELNIQLRREVDELQDWYEKHWLEAEEVSPDILEIIEKHTREYSPFDVYFRSMAAYFQSHEVSVSEWERTKSVMYPVLSQYQREGYHRLMEIARRYRGALLCDGVGLGKTFIGLMVIERLLYERKRVALFVPKAAREDVWENKLAQYMPKASGEYSNLRVYSHTDLLRGGNYLQIMQEIADEADAFVIDEAHHFRNIGSQRARKFYEMTEGKELFLLTATPINNSLFDLMHLIEYFSRRQTDYFRDAPLGIYSLLGRFRQMENALNTLTGKPVSSDIVLDPMQAEEILSKDDLFQALVVQRSRAYVKASLKQEENDEGVSFPVRKDPNVANYSLRKTYGRLLDMLKEGFDKDNPLVRLPIYFPLKYLIKEDGVVDEFEYGRQMQVVGLIRTLLLKRFESSAVSFRASCEDLLIKMLYFIQIHNPKTAQRWEDQHAELINQIREHLGQRGLLEGDEENLDEDIIPEEFKKKIETLDDKKYNVTSMVMDALLDMDELAKYLRELSGFDPTQDDKIQTLIRLIKTDPILRQHKILIFTEYLSTARYLAEQLLREGIGKLVQVDSQRNNAGQAVHAFAPYYNDSCSANLVANGVDEIRVLISTDILAEGLNLQDAACIINYDLHWNPVRLLQRIGRVDRRLEPRVEARMLADHPELAEVRGTVFLWNFLPPNELNEILSLYERVTHKALRISKTFGIEGKKFLTPNDDYEALHEFNQRVEGTTTSTEAMYLAYQQLLQDHPGLLERIPYLPKRVYSGKAHPIENAKAVFFCYQLPAKNADGEWVEEAAFTRWYLYEIETGDILEDATHIVKLIESTPETPRRTNISRLDLSAIRRQLDKHITDTYLKKVQALQGVEATLLAWMELN